MWKTVNKISDGLMKELIRARAAVEQEKPLIHCITSPVAINDCANVVLALGAKPIMAEHPEEVEQITAIAKALSVSTANITDARMKSIMISGSLAMKQKIPCVIDVVGVTCSKMRLELVREFIEKCKPAVIKGNVSEIKAVAGVKFDSVGIDVGDSDAVKASDIEALKNTAATVKEFARKTNAVVMASGETDIISDGSDVYFIQNGSASMANVTGTGCMLNVITGVYLSSSEPLAAALLAAATLGICGELADDSRGMGTYHISLIDELSLFNNEKLLANMKIYKM